MDRQRIEDERQPGKGEADTPRPAQPETATEQHAAQLTGATPRVHIDASQMNTAQRAYIKEVREEAFSEGMTEAQLKWEHDIFRDALSNANQNLRFQMSLGVPLLAACVTVLNLVPPQSHQELLNNLDRWVFLPVLASIVIAFKGLEKHWYIDKKLNKLDDGNIDQLYELVRFKYKMSRIALTLQGSGLILMMAFVLLEYR